jgi:hypothetical protein
MPWAFDSWAPRSGRTSAFGRGKRHATSLLPESAMNDFRRIKAKTVTYEMWRRFLEQQ